MLNRWPGGLGQTANHAIVMCQLVIDGARQHGLPDHYVDQLRRVPAVTDPDLSRHALHQRILNAHNGSDSHSVTGSGSEA